MKYQKELSERLSRALGRDVSDVIAELYAMGVLDEVLARRGCVRGAFYELILDTSMSTTAVVSRVADQYHMGETTVRDVVR